MPNNKQHSFADAMKIELVYEGGKDDDPRDPGGRTMNGITQRVYAAYRLRKGLPARDVFLMQSAERDEIYFTQYGQKIYFDQLPPGVDLVMLDGAINSGVTQSIKWAQRALGLTANGVLGEVTLQRIQDHPDHDRLIADILARRMAFLRALTTFSHFGGGWTARVNSLRTKGQAWAMGSVGPEVIYVPNGNKKATVVDAVKLVSTAPADATSAGGAVTTGLTTAQSTLSPLAGNSHLVDQLLMALVVLGVLATVGGLAWAWYARRTNNNLNDVLDLVVQPAPSDNDNIPVEVLQEYVDPTATGSATGNIAPGVVTTSGRVAGDTEVRVNSVSPNPDSENNKAA